MRTALVTGATSGIGLALAEQLAARGDRVVLVGRRTLDEFDHPLLRPDTYCRVDLAAPEAADTIAAWCTTHGVDRIDLLVNNAGVGWTGPLWEQPAASIRDLVDVNVAAPIDLTQRLLARVRAASGTVVFVSSVVSTVAAPDMAVYVATKQALDGFARSLRAERSCGDVTFRVVHPGATRTAMPDKVGIPTTTSASWRSADSVAAEILDGLDGRANHRAIGRSNALLRGVARRLPGPMAAVAGRSAPDPPELPSPNAVPRVLVTGAADGIGRALALRHARAGAEVVGLDVDAERAAITAEEGAGRIRFHVADLRDDGTSWLAAEAPFDVVVHNAGISAVGPFESIDPAAHRAVLDLNLTAPMCLTAALLAGGRLTMGARIVLMSSLSHQLGYPGAAVYAASKDGLELYGRALGAALGPTIRTTTVFPGPTRTAHAARYSPSNDEATVARRMDPDELARRIIDHDGRRLRPGALAGTSAALGTLSPRLGEAVMRATVYRPLTATER